jgi:hypothetical protein
MVAVAASSLSYAHDAPAYLNSSVHGRSDGVQGSKLFVD